MNTFGVGRGQYTRTVSSPIMPNIETSTSDVVTSGGREKEGGRKGGREGGREEGREGKGGREEGREGGGEGREGRGGREGERK